MSNDSLYSVDVSGRGLMNQDYEKKWHNGNSNVAQMTEINSPLVSLQSAFFIVVKDLASVLKSD